MCSSHVQVLKVCAVRLVEIPVAIVYGIEATRYHWRKEVFRLLGTRLKIQLIANASYDSDMPETGDVLEVEECNDDCQDTPDAP